MLLVEQPCRKDIGCLPIITKSYVNASNNNSQFDHTLADQVMVSCTGVARRMLLRLYSCTPSGQHVCTALLPGACLTHLADYVPISFSHQRPQPNNCVTVGIC